MLSTSNYKLREDGRENEKERERENEREREREFNQV